MRCSMIKTEISDWAFETKLLHQAPDLFDVHDYRGIHMKKAHVDTSGPLIIFPVLVRL